MTKSLPGLSALELNTRVVGRVDESIGKLITQFGKLGLLIDDKEDAKDSTATEIYGSEQIPSWWYQCKTVEEGLAAIRILNRDFVAEGSKNSNDQAHEGMKRKQYIRGPSEIALLVIVDRFVPLFGRETPPKDWYGLAIEGRTSPRPMVEAGGVRESQTDSQLVDQREIKLCLEMLKGLEQLEVCLRVSPRDSHVRGKVLFVTSYRPGWSRKSPVESTADSEILPNWLHRTDDPIFGTLWPSRASGDTTEFTPLLTYGPIRTQSATALPGASKSSRWWQTVESVKFDLEDPEASVILLTGAGVSVKLGPEPDGPPASETEPDGPLARETESDRPPISEAEPDGPEAADTEPDRPLAHGTKKEKSGSALSQSARVGMPWNEWLFEFACWWTLRSVCIREFMDRLPPPGRGEDSTAPAVPAEWILPSAPPFSPAGEGFGQLLRAYMRKGRLEKSDLASVSFNDLFKIDRTRTQREGITSKGRQTEDRFREGLRLIMTQHDRGVPMAHWLASRLPLDFIVTTNFDTFHERAAAAAVREVYERKDAKRVLELGSTYDPRPAAVYAPHELEPRLFKLYGSLSAPETLAFEPAEFALRNHRLRDAILKASVASSRLRLLVVGHALNDAPLVETIIATIQYFCSERHRRKASIVWIIPSAEDDLEEISELVPEGRRLTEEDVKGTKFSLNHAECLSKILELERAGVEVTPISSTAVAFLYDLWYLFCVTRDPRKVDGNHHLSA